MTKPVLSHTRRLNPADPDPGWGTVLTDQKHPHLVEYHAPYKAALLAPDFRKWLNENAPTVNIERPYPTLYILRFRDADEAFRFKMTFC